MPAQTSKSLLLAAIVATVATVGSRYACAWQGAVEDKTTVLVSPHNRPVFRYRHADVPMKPCVDQLYSPAGVQVLRDSPHDHKHHHALMFATAVDGVDFWGELPQCGTQKKRSLDLINHAIPDGLWRYGLAEELDWIGTKSDKPLLVESRAVFTLENTGKGIAGPGATLIEWRSILRTPPGKQSVVLSGNVTEPRGSHHYFGLGMRFVQSMDSGGRFFNADDEPGEVIRGDERLTPTKWCVLVAKADGKPVTVAIFDHPQNPRYPAMVFTMSKPFAYLSATRDEWRHPITIKTGEPLGLRFGIAVWDGEVDKRTVEKTYQHWLELSRKS